MARWFANRKKKKKGSDVQKRKYRYRMAATVVAEAVVAARTQAVDGRYEDALVSYEAAVQLIAQ